jgi:hypothetical protein
MAEHSIAKLIRKSKQNPVRWIIEGLWQEGGIVVVHSLEEEFKSVASYQIAEAVASGKPDISSADLLDVYIEMVEVASELQGLSLEDGIWGGGGFSTEFAQLGAKASVLGAKIGVTLRSQVAGQEVKLAVCSQKPTSDR